MASDEAAGWRTGFILNHTFLYDSFEIESQSGPIVAYHTSTNRRQLEKRNVLYLQVLSAWAGHVVGADSNRNDVRVAASVDFWMDLGPRPDSDREQNWFTHFGNDIGSGKFYQAIDPLIDPNWWVDPTLGDPLGNVNDVLVDPAYSVPTERPSGGTLCHSQLSVTLAVKSES